MNDIPESAQTQREKLLDHLVVLRNFRRLMRGRRRNEANWIIVKELFGVGSTTAHAMCREMGVDPEAMTA
jgi:hypothetical protein